MFHDNKITFAAGEWDEEYPLTRWGFSQSGKGTGNFAYFTRENPPLIETG
jgi:hypothetical protein